MDKQKFVKFIDKYNLGGTINAVILGSKDNVLHTRFTTGDKSLLGILSMKNWDFEDGEFGVYNTDQLLKLLSVLDNDITMVVAKAGDKAHSLRLSDSVSSVNFMLSDTTVINKPPNPQKLPETFGLKVDVTTQFIEKFIDGKKALPETDTFTVITDNNNVKVVIGYSATMNTNRVIIPVNVNDYQSMNMISFQAGYFKEILTANKECESATLEVSEDGIARINFKIDDYNATYYLVAVQDVD